MATALARGWRRPVLCADPVRERALALAQETGGEALAGNAEVAMRADLVVLAHKPAQLEEVAREVAPHARAVASILAVTPLARLRAAYAGRPVYRFLPSVTVEVRAGAIVQAQDSAPGHGGQSAQAPGRQSAPGAGERAAREAAVGQPVRDGALDARVRALFAQLGTLVRLDEALIDAAMGLMSCAPAYLALLVEAQVDAGVRYGIPAAQGSELVVATLAGTAELLRARGHDTLALRRAVTSPGGVTARGLHALERAGARAAMEDAMDAVMKE
jgi:pyrroline-5-carboxylate reductase